MGMFWSFSKMNIRLTPKTGKNKIHEADTDTFKVTRVLDTVRFSDKSGPWLLISPVFRWVHQYDDENFIVEVL